MNGRQLREADDIARELDLAVFALERAPEPDTEAGLREERTTLRRRLDKLRQRLQDLADELASG